MQAADFFAVTGAATLALLALLHGMVWHAQRQRWAALFALCMAMGALYFAFDPWLRPVQDRVNPAGTVLGALLLLTMQAALIDYVGLPRHMARALLLVTVVTGVLLMGARLAGWLPRGLLLLAGSAAWVDLALRRGQQLADGGGPEGAVEVGRRLAWSAALGMVILLGCYVRDGLAGAPVAGFATIAGHPGAN